MSYKNIGQEEFMNIEIDICTYVILPSQNNLLQVIALDKPHGKLGLRTLSNKKINEV
jgi:hypothetical protein